MANAFLFDGRTKAAARLRQDSRCAACGENLNDLVEHAHHVIPKQTGSASPFADQWLRTVDNCVIVCDHCHTAYHGHGRFRDVTAEPAVFKFTHGKNQGAHQQWLMQVNTRFRQMGKKAG